MKLVFRCDGDGRMGGGHVMRCLTLAHATQRRGWSARFVMAEGGMIDRVRHSGFEVVTIPASSGKPDPEAPSHGDWLTAPWQADAEITAEAAQHADWLIWDHYGLDARWVQAVGAKHAMALDDLDDRPLGSDILLDITRLEGLPSHGADVQLTGPAYAPLRPEFSAARQAALARRTGAVKHVLIMPGLVDAVGLAPLALAALDKVGGVSGEVVMGPDAQSLDATRHALGSRHRLSLDPDDLPQRMVEADLCIGASGMTNWERCTLGLPTVAIAVAENQRPGLDRLARVGAVEPLTLEDARDPDLLAEAVHRAIDRSADLSRNAAKLCDGQGADRVLDAIDWAFRPLTLADEKRLFDWRNRPEIRTVSHSAAPLDPQVHHEWITRVVERTDGIWTIYQEGGHALGYASAVPGDESWIWSFYLGEAAPPRTGTRMMRRFLDHLAAQGVPHVTGEVRAGNDASVALHKRLGFTQTGQRDGVLVFARTIGETRG